MKILNLYAGIGGNRRLWSDHDITAVEMSPEIAAVYKQLYPSDTVVVDDAVDYLEKHYAEFDFIWSSPPCPSHGQYRHNVGVIGKGFDPIMPDMTLYSQIIFLQHYAKCKWVIENVKPYYEPLVPAVFEMQRHLFWSNFTAPDRKFYKADIRHKNKISDFDGYEIVASSKIPNKRQALRNCVNPELGLHIFESAFK
jgi:DNA (cytosine-5)-methyltransferase 1